MAEPSLDHYESPVTGHAFPSPPAHPDAADGVIRNFLHAGWHATRSRILRALHAAQQPISSTAHFARCGEGWWILRHNDFPDRYKAVRDLCGSRWCRVCGRIRRNRIADNLARELTAPPYRLLTLTLRSTDKPLDHQLRRLVAAFRRLRATDWWKAKVIGGVAMIEVTYNATTDQWHPHLHVICDGLFLPHHQLRDIWHAITRDSTIVDVRLIRQTKDAAAYVAKYASKPVPDNVTHDQHVLVEAIRALHGRKLCLTFGTWRRMRLVAPPDAAEWTMFTHSDNLSRLRDNGDERYLDLRLLIAAADDAGGSLEIDIAYDLPPPYDAPIVRTTLNGDLPTPSR